MGEPRGSCVQFTPGAHEDAQLTTASGSINGGHSNFDLQDVSSMETLTDLSNLNAAASVGFGIFSGDFSAQFLKQSAIQEFSSYLFVHVWVANEAQILRSMVLTKEARDALAKGYSAFFAHCGDQFVAGRVTGGELLAVVQFRSHSSAEQQQTRTAIAAAVTAFGIGGKSSAAFDNSLNTLVQSSDLQIHFLRSGPTEQIPGLAELKQYAMDFPCKVGATDASCAQSAPAGLSSSRVLYSLSMQGYQGVQGMNDQAIDSRMIRNQQNLIGIVSDWLLHLYSDRSTIAYVEQFPAEFTDASTKQAQADQPVVEAGIRTLQNSAANCESDPVSGCVSPPMPIFSGGSYQRLASSSSHKGWVRTDSAGNLLFKEWPFRYSVISSGDPRCYDNNGTDKCWKLLDRYTLSDQYTQIYNVSWASCTSSPGAVDICGFAFSPHRFLKARGDGSWDDQYGADYKLSDDQHSVSIARIFKAFEPDDAWATITYRIYYERYEDICDTNCGQRGIVTNGITRNNFLSTPRSRYRAKVLLVSPDQLTTLSNRSGH